MACLDEKGGGRTEGKRTGAMRVGQRKAVRWMEKGVSCLNYCFEVRASQKAPPKELSSFRLGTPWRTFSRRYCATCSALCMLADLSSGVDDGLDADARRVRLSSRAAAGLGAVSPDRKRACSHAAVSQRHIPNRARASPWKTRRWARMRDCRLDDGYGGARGSQSVSQSCSRAVGVHRQWTTLTRMAELT